MGCSAPNLFTKVFAHSNERKMPGHRERPTRWDRTMRIRKRGRRRNPPQNCRRYLELTTAIDGGCPPPSNPMCDIPATASHSKRRPQSTGLSTSHTGTLNCSNFSTKFSPWLSYCNSVTSRHQYRFSVRTIFLDQNL